MTGKRPRWVTLDLPLAVVVVLLLVLAFVLPSVLSDDDPRVAGSATRSPAASTGPDDQGSDDPGPVPAPTVSPLPSGGTPGGPRGTAPGGACVALPAPRLTVATFNMHSALDTSRTQVLLDQVAAELERYQADVLVLQEVDRNRLWSARTDQPAYLADRLGMHYAFGTNVLRTGDREYGTAILSRYPMTDVENTALPNGPGGQQRGLLNARIEPFGIPVSVYDTHLENTSADLRVAQARRIAQIVGGDPLPTVLGGDLNSGPGSSVLATLRGQLTDSWAGVGADAGFTHPSSAPRARIDYLLHARGLVPIQSVVVPSAVSDHDGVRTVYELPTQSSRICLPDLGDG
jgi:endonuclease/exonuclease/phosphatase family metal-dependent hydrolase